MNYEWRKHKCKTVFDAHDFVEKIKSFYLNFFTFILSTKKKVK